VARPEAGEAGRGKNRDGDESDMGAGKANARPRQYLRRSSSPPMIMPVDKNLYLCLYPSDGRVSGTHGYMTC
jgi:hypothetical protein